MVAYLGDPVRRTPCGGRWSSSRVRHLCLEFALAALASVHESVGPKSQNLWCWGRILPKVYNFPIISLLKIKVTVSKEENSNVQIFEVKVQNLEFQDHFQKIQSLESSSVGIWKY